MTGTAITEEEEFGEIYKLDVIDIPTNTSHGAKGSARYGLQDRERQSSAQ